MGTGSFPGVKRPGRGADHPPPFSAEVEGRVELYICSPSGPSWPGLRRTLPLPLLAGVEITEGAKNCVIVNEFLSSLTVYVKANGPSEQGLVSNRIKKFHVVLNVHANSGAHKAFNPMGSGGVSPEGKAAEASSNTNLNLVLRLRTPTLPDYVSI